VCVCVQALCAAVVLPDVLQTMQLVFSGADVMCATGDPASSTPYLLAQRAGQKLQMEFLHQNKLSGKQPQSGHPPPPIAVYHDNVYCWKFSVKAWGSTFFLTYFVSHNQVISDVCQLLDLFFNSHSC